MQNLAFGIIAIVLACLITALVAEIVLDFTYPQPTQARIAQTLMPIFQDDPTTVYTLIPNSTVRHTDYLHGEWDVSVIVDDAGFRDNVSHFELRNMTRVLCLGDSQTFGWGVSYEQSYCAVAGRTIIQLTGKPVQVINAGFTCGYSFDSCALYLRKHVAQLAPDIVVYGFFYPNDLTDPLTHTYSLTNGSLRRASAATDGEVTTDMTVVGEIASVRNPGLRFVNGRLYGTSTRIHPAWLAPIHEFLNKHSNLYVLTKNSLKPLLLKLFVSGQTDASDQQCNSEFYQSSYLEHLWNQSAVWITNMESVCVANNCTFYVLQLPSKEEVDKERFAQSLTARNFNRTTADWNYPNAKFIDLCTSRQFRCVYTLDTLRAANTYNSFYLDIDGHNNAAGFDLIGKTLGAVIAADYFHVDLTQNFTEYAAAITAVDQEHDPAAYAYAAQSK